MTRKCAYSTGRVISKNMADRLFLSANMFCFLPECFYKATRDVHLQISFKLGEANGSVCICFDHSLEIKNLVGARVINLINRR